MQYYDFNSLEKMGFTVQQHRADNSTDSGKPGDNAKGNGFVFTRQQWAIPIPPVTVPFDFELIAIGPNSHVSIVCVKPPGQQTRFVSVKTPLIGKFPSGTMIFPYRSMNSFLDAGYLELIVYPNEPDGIVPLSRVTFVRVVDTGKLVYLTGALNDPDFVVSSPSRTIIDGRSRLTICMSGVSSSYHVRWYYGFPYNWGDVGGGFVAPFNVSSDETYNFLTATPITLNVPTGATSFGIIDNATGVEVVSNPSIYIAAED